MFRKASIRTKLTGLILSLVVFTILMAAYFSYEGRVSNLEERYLKNLSALSELKVQEFKAFVSQGEKSVSFIAGNPSLVLSAAGSDEEEEEDGFGFAFDMGMDDDDDDDFSFGDDGEEDNAIADVVEPLLSGIDAMATIITNNDGHIKYKSLQISEDNIRKIIPVFEPQMVSSAEGIYKSSVFKFKDKFCMVFGRKNSNNDGMVFIFKDLTQLYASLENTLHLGETVEVILAEKRNRRAVFLNPLKFEPEAALEKGPFIDDKTKGIATINAVEGQNGAGYTIDYRGERTFAVWKHIEDPGLGLIVKIDLAEIQGDGIFAVKRFLLWSIIILVIGLFISILFSQYFIGPLIQLRDSMGMISKGILPDQIEKRHNDEVGQMAETTNELVLSLRRTANFAERIGKGQFDADFTPLSKGDMLGNALVEMRNSLQENEKRDAQRNWIVTGVAEISEILRSHNQIEDLANEVIAFITEKVEAIQGAFYVVADEDSEDGRIHMTAAYAYHKKKYLKSSFKFAEGLVGQAAAEKDTVLRTEIPNEYVTITSGLLGDKRPRCLLITPMIAEEEVYGVLEFASFNRFTERQIKFVEEISVIIARTIFNIKVNARTVRLLEESQKMSNELKEQQEILRQNAEEMAATQEELRRTNQRLEDQIEEVNRTQNRMQLLLENASEVISIYEENLTVRYISPSVEKILGYPQNDIIGTSDKDHVHPAGAPFFEKMFEDVISNPFESCTVQYEYTKKNGDTIWLEATATNLLSDPAIQGIVVNSRDITERRRAELEERMRSKMQALSENSPDLITRFDHEGNFFYINPMIESYTGYKPHDFLNRNLMDVSIDDSVKDSWLSILREVESKNEKVAREMDFPSEMGARVMNVNAIPEFDENEKVESVLVVSHDITDRKLIELEIQSKNKKITESINYAKRIQGAILPDNAIISQFLPESFILYKARDVVSGDFPWFLRVDGVIYFAAVDCTGHGVPGALISLIGYFLLNEIVRGRKISDPGLILDELDQGVTQTLRQDQEDSKTKDGMDIALCRIDLKKNEVSYAGAHRPLLVMSGGELNEVKGNKFAIGGGVYKNQTNFQTTTIKMNPGDAVYFCSDGFTDQFGGPDNRKFGPARLRDLVKDNYKKKMMDQYTICDEVWEDWKGDQKQTDDVLLIGVKF
ncbi:MAG: PAS domain S-box protein [Cyclobacteriaceae bacterium]